jgi:ribonuclease PH
MKLEECNMRIDGRRPDDLRRTVIVPGYLDFPEGSALIIMGNTRVLCTVTVEDRLPAFLTDQEQGWITAEYSMLPRSTKTRTPRESHLGRLQGRTQEIQRLIGRSLRAAFDLKALGQRTFIVDCDVLQADGGTRTAAITAGYVALAIALMRSGIANNLRRVSPTPVAAVSVGVVQGTPVLDLCYEEDSTAEVDFNVVMNGKAEYVEIQGTAEHRTFSQATLEELLNLARSGIARLQDIQMDALVRAGVGY